ncbi:MAG: hypothetical protein FJX57_20965 [Alphaproteobacteria bacterium]|nr:hypothetical protein [Alphaproteobacteria bacterium]
MRVTPYSIRHTMARELRKRRVPTEQISLFLGHVPVGVAATTSIYASYDPGFLGDAIAAIEDVMRELRAHLKRARLEAPQPAPNTPAELTDRAGRRGIGEGRRREVVVLLLAGVANRQIAERAQVSSGTIGAIRRELKALEPFYRAVGSEDCVPFASRVGGSPPQSQRQRLEKASGPGRTRTCNHTVMSVFRKRPRR